MKAYNDWMIDEWCGTDPGRLIPLAIIPLWGPHWPSPEMERVNAKGCRSICFSENFEPLGLPTIHTGHWDPVLQAANDLQMVLSIHIGSSSTFHRISKDSPFMANFSLGMIRPAGCLMDWIFSGLFQRFPNIKIALSEGLDRLDPLGARAGPAGVRRPSATGWPRAWPSATWVRSRTTTRHIDTEKIDVYRDYREHFYGCFIDDATGLGMLDVVGEDNVMIECDYPHSDTTWPHSLKLAHERLDAANLTDEVKYKILRGNAERLYQFTPSAPPEVTRP